MKTTNIELPKVVTRAEWLVARKELLAKEKELTRRRDALNAERRRLPMSGSRRTTSSRAPTARRICSSAVWTLSRRVTI